MKKGIVFAIVLAVVIAAVATASLLNTSGSSGKGSQNQGTKTPPKGESANNVGGQVLFQRATKDKSDTSAMKVAETDTLQMFLEGTGTVYIVNKKSGKTWYSYPADRTKLPQKEVVENPILIKITQAGSAPLPTYPGKEEGTITAAAIDGGVRITYDLTSLAIGFAMEYRLTSSGMSVKVPFNSITEGKKNKLISLEPLPFFDGALPTEQGYLFVPDGSGALIRFKPAHVNYFDHYSQPVYGGDGAFTSQVVDQSAIYPSAYVYPSPREKVALPVFGMKRGDQGYAAFITEGDYDARINVSPSGYQNQNVYRSAVELTYRKSDSIFIGDSNEIPTTQGKIIEGDRSVTYVLLEGKQADYVGMANAYRNYLTNEQNVKPATNNQPAFQMRLFGGVKRNDMIGSTLIKMTGFQQAKAIIDAWLSKGMSSFELTYEGWSNDGIFGKQPKHFPVEGSLGGEKELRNLIDYAKSKGVNVYLSANYFKPFAANASFQQSKDAVRGLNKEVMKLYDSHLATRQTSYGRVYYMVKPNLVVDKFISKEIGKYTELGTSGIKLEYVGNFLYSDQDKKNSVSRKETIADWIHALDYTRGKIGRVAVDYGFAYALGHIDRIDNAPYDSSHYVFEDETVPFYQLVVGGLVPMTGKPGNLRDDSVNEALRLIEYGIAPSYELTYADSSELRRTYYDKLFSSAYGDWLERAAAEYGGVERLFKQIAGQPLVDHQKLDEQVYKSTYAGGTEVIVNYSSSARTFGNISVAAQNFAISKKGGG